MRKETAKPKLDLNKPKKKKNTGNKGGERSN
jgi:hypothetical protein